MTDLVLLEEVKNGNNKAFPLLVNRYKAKIYYTIYMMVHNQTDAEDLTMEILTKIFLHIKKFNPEAKLSTWIFEITRNHGVDFLRTKSHRPSDLVELDYKQVSPTLNPEEILLNKEIRQRLDVMVNTFSSPRKEITQLYLKGWEYTEISDKLNIPLGTICNYIHRSKNQIKTILL